MKEVKGKSERERERVHVTTVRYQKLVIHSTSWSWNIRSWFSEKSYTQCRRNKGHYKRRKEDEYGNCISSCVCIYIYIYLNKIALDTGIPESLRGVFKRSYRMSLIRNYYIYVTFLEGIYMHGFMAPAFSTVPDLYTSMKLTLYLYVYIKHVYLHEYRERAVFVDK